MKYLSLPISPELQLFSGFGFCCVSSISSLWFLFQNLVRSCFSFAHFTELRKSAWTGVQCVCMQAADGFVFHFEFKMLL